MALYLVQHGKSLPKDEDPAKGLSVDGIAETRRIADVAVGYCVTVSKIVHSGKQRALETARIFKERLNPPEGIVRQDGLGPLDDVTSWMERLDPVANIMLVGHLPFMERLTGYLLTGDFEKTVFKFQNSGIVCIDRLPDSQAWFIKWSLMPHID